MALKAALNGVRAKFGTGEIRAGVKRADKVLCGFPNLKQIDMNVRDGFLCKEIMKRMMQTLARIIF